MSQHSQTAIANESAELMRSCFNSSSSRSNYEAVETQKTYSSFEFMGMAVLNKDSTYYEYVSLDSTTKAKLISSAL